MSKLRVGDWAFIVAEQPFYMREAKKGVLVEINRVDNSDVPYRASLISVHSDQFHWFFASDLEHVYSPEEVQRAPAKSQKDKVSDAESGVPKP